MKVLVTGGSGLVGNSIRNIVESDQYFFMSRKDGDLRSKETTMQLFESFRPTHVIHLAARVGGIFSNIQNNLEFFEDNIQINSNVVNACHVWKVQHAIFCLSTCVFPAHAHLPLTESQLHEGPPHSSNEGYAYSKRMMECLVRYYRKAYGYKHWLCVIPTNLYGPHDNFNVVDAHVIPSLIGQCRECVNKSLPSLLVAGTGMPVRQFMYAPDLARVILKLLASESEEISVICCDNSEVSISSVAHMIVDFMGFNGEIVFDPSKSDGINRKTASNQKLLAIIGSDFRFTPLSEGLKLTCKWFDDSSNDSIRL